jgi:signal transduction histidine kinase
MTSPEIRPGQLRALLLLLFLVPLIPTALMVRFMADTLRVERLTALDRAQQFHAESLTAFFRTLKVSEEGSDAERAAKIVRQWEQVTGPDAQARIVDESGRLLAGEVSPWDRPIASAPVPALKGATLQVHLAGPQTLDDNVAEQRRFLIWTGVLTTLAVVTIAGLAALALGRQLALHELKNTSVATVAHELRTPLASMRMLVDTLREGRVRSDEQRREYLELIAAENERLSRLAENFLTFSRLERGTQPVRLEPVPAREIVERAVAPLRARLDAVNFTVEVPESLPAVRADREALPQVFTNLLDNALKYTGEEKRIALRARVDGPRLAFSVEDNGLGLSREERSAVFRPFYQVDQKLSRTREGCGLGLTIVRRIVEAHGGEIEVASEPGKGSVFTVKLPLA